jgi:hypothetical protein
MLDHPLIFVVRDGYSGSSLPERVGCYLAGTDQSLDSLYRLHEEVGGDENTVAGRLRLDELADLIPDN